ncbi:MAG: sigma-70 family RNA polymerase sigma factor [Clostridia bacterium]|nr:sigma-70 family RNA polymerase sigma factor [Clostridia bacterium]
MNDMLITDLLNKRDETALVYIKQSYGAGITDIAYNILKNRQDAEEVLSDTLLTVWNNIPPDQPVNLPGYIYKTARNRALHVYRKNKQKKRSAVTVCIDELGDCISDGDVEGEMDERSLSELIDFFLSSLDAENRRIFISRFYYNMEYKQIAEKYGLGLSRVKMSVKRSKDKLKELLSKEGY